MGIKMIEMGFIGEKITAISADAAGSAGIFARCLSIPDEFALNRIRTTDH